MGLSRLLQVLQVQNQCKLDTITSGNLWDPMFCPYAVPTGLTMAGVALLMAFGGFFGLWSWSRELTLPTTWLALMSGVAIASLPGRTATVVGSIIAIGVTVGGYGLWRATR